jgi:hypothetical protein
MVGWPQLTGTEVGCSMVRESPFSSRTRNAEHPEVHQEPATARERDP